MDPHPENNKKFAELVGICWHDYEIGSGKCSCGRFGSHANPNFAADPRLVLREMERIGKLMGFLIELNLGACGFIYSYIFDETGKFRDEAIEWIREK